MLFTPVDFNVSMSNMVIRVQIVNIIRIKFRDSCLIALKLKLHNTQIDT